MVEATGALYERVGFERPSIGHVARQAGEPVGACGFKSPPRAGRDEFASSTFPDREGRGIAAAMEAALVKLSRARSERRAVRAHWLPRRNAAHRVPERIRAAFATLRHSSARRTAWCGSGARRTHRRRALAPHRRFEAQAARSSE